MLRCSGAYVTGKRDGDEDLWRDVNVDKGEVAPQIRELYNAGLLKTDCTRVSL